MSSAKNSAKRFANGFAKAVPVATFSAVFSIFVFVAALLLASVGCTHKSSGNGNGAGADTAAVAPGAELKVGLVLDKGGKDDRSFNSSAFRGATLAVKDFHIALKNVESADDAAFEPALRTFAERGYPLVIAIGFSQIDAVKKVAPQFPKTHFALVDGVVDAPNVESIMFAEHEGSYLVGYLAGLMTKTNKVGFIGGMDIPLTRRFELGYSTGVQAANKKAQVVVNYIGVNSSAWTNPSRGKELALSQYNRGIDVIFHAAGASGLGVFDAAEEKKAYAIGVDSNQDDIKPGRVATSMLKRVDNAVYDVIQDQIHGKFTAGKKTLGLSNKGIDYSVDASNEKIIAPYKAQLEAIREKIIKGQIFVPDYYQAQKIDATVKK